MEEKFTTCTTVTIKERKTLLRTEIQILKDRLETMKKKLVEKTLDEMKKNFEHSVENTEELKKLITESDNFDDLDLQDYDGYILRDNHSPHNTHVSWTYEQLKTFSTTLENLHELQQELDDLVEE